MSTTEDVTTGKFVIPALTSLGINADTIDAAQVRVTHLLTEAGEQETVIEFVGLKMQTYETGPAEIAAAFRRLADRIEEAHR